MLINYTPWDKELAETYRAEKRWLDIELSDILERQVQNNKLSTAIIYREQHISYKSLDNWSSQLAKYLCSQGFKAGDTAVVQLDNSPSFYITFFALLKVGIVPVNALFNHNKKELFNYIEQVQPKLVIGSAQHALFKNAEFIEHLNQSYSCIESILIDGKNSYLTDLQSIWNESASLDCQWNLPLRKHQADQVAFFQLSGGSTGTPKLIPRTHNDYYYSIRQSVSVCQWDKSVRYLCALPAAHNFPLSSPGALGAFFAGGTVILAPDPSPSSCLPLIMEHQVNWAALVPPAVALWLDAADNDPDAFHSLKYLQVGGARLSLSLAKRVESELDVTLQQVFGMAEGLVNYTRIDDDEWTRLNTQGRPMSDADEIRIVDEHNQPVSMGEEGLLTTRGAYTFRGYYRAPEHNRTAFTPEGFYVSGDLVKQTDTGHLIVTGRSKDQINRGGEKIAAEEVENELLAHEYIHYAALISIPDNALGEKSCAVLVCPESQPKPITLRKFLRSKGLADYKIPDKFTFIDAMPLTAVGKVDKRALQAITNKQVL